MAAPMKVASDLPSFMKDIFVTEDAIPKNYVHEVIEQKQYVCNGKVRTWDGPQVSVISPICIQTPNGPVNKILGSIPSLEEKDVMEAVDAAVKAYDQGLGAWPKMSVSERIPYMQRFVVMMKEQRERVVQLLMWEICKNRKAAEGEFDRTVEYILDTIESLKELDRGASRLTIEQGIIAQIRRAPLGVCLCMGPFNYPLNETYSTLIPAILMGNTVVFKPARFGVLLHYPLLQAYATCFPPGVLNVIYGQGAKVITPVMKSGKIDVSAFIGSSKVADTLKQNHPKPHRLRCIFGLEAKNTAIVLPDADLNVATSECLLGSLSFNGQRCTALKLLCVHKSIVDQFNKMYIEKLEKMKCGLPWDNADLTPIPEASKVDYLLDICKDAETKGAKIINPNGGKYNGSFFYPAVLYPVNKSMRIFHEEQFGPVVPIMAYTDVQECIDVIRESNYGQQCAIFGNEPTVIGNLVDSLTTQVCRVNINSQCQRGPDVFPFTGRKDSAEGTLSVSDALRVFSIRTLVATKATDSNKAMVRDITFTHKSKFLNTDFIL